MFATLRASTIDCYNNHASLNDFFTVNTRNSVSRKIGVILQEIANIKNLRMQIANNNGCEEIELLTRRINLMQERIENTFRELPTLQFFENLDLTAQPDIFFETLAITLKNEALSFQSHFYNSKNATKKSLRDQIKNLKSNYAQNRDIIFDLEMQLSTIVELELKYELSTVKNFERLNDEKITPFFLKLAKNQKRTIVLRKLLTTITSSMPLTRTAYIVYTVSIGTCTAYRAAPIRTLIRIRTRVIPNPQLKNF